jgi:UDP-N-acetylmuramoyl-tripeptide--D-alanyl-D-alanine ligase
MDMDSSRIKSLYERYLGHPKVCIDHRKLQPGNGFVALKGSRVDGNTFVGDALNMGAAWVLCENRDFVDHPNVWTCSNTVKGLQQLAALHRQHLKGKVLCVAGSNGKTTNKELLYACFSEAFRTECTQGNFNNHLGVPLTLLSFSMESEWYLVEIGANHIGETALLTDLAKPSVGLVTNNGKDHLEGFGDEAGVRKANAELYHWLAKHGGVALVPDFHADLMEDSAHQSRWVYGWKPSSDFQGKALELGHRPGLQLEGWEGPVWSQLAGTFNSENMMHAAAAAVWAGVSMEAVRKGLESYRPALMRSQWIETKGWKILLDADNANPSSMEKAINSFLHHAQAPYGFLLADMLELGSFSEFEHLRLAEKLSESKAEKIVLIGAEWAKCHQVLPNALYFSSTQEALEKLDSEALKPMEWLVKGSRGFTLEKLLQAWGVL